MLTATVTTTAAGTVNVRLSSAYHGVVAAEESEKPEGTPPNPIAPTANEMYWAGGAFLVMFVIMRYFLFPRLKKGMDARYEGIRSDLDTAEKVKADAKGDVADYERALAEVRAEAAGRIDAARQKVDAERTARLTEVNAKIASARAEADQRIAAARESARGQVESAVAQVAARAAELATGKTPDPSVVQSAVKAAMETGGSR